MNESLLHPTPDRWEAFVEGSLSDADRTVLESHLLGCSRCAAEVEELRTLFGMLAGLPRWSPAAGFADRVLAGVRVPQPWAARLAAVLSRLVPRSTAGWALVAALMALPIAVSGGALAWIFSRPGLTPQMLFVFIRDRAGDAVLSLAGRAATSVMESGVALWLVERVGAMVGEAGPAELGAVAATFATVMLVSIWVLYQNLFRTSTRDARYVSYSF